MTHSFANSPRARRHASEFVFQGSMPFAQVHASTLVQLPDGRIACAWFGGTREGAPDVAIWLSERTESGWTPPRRVADDSQYPTWNPVLFAPRPTEAGGAQSELLLYYRVGPNPREWWSYVMQSRDRTQSWSDPQPLPEGILGPIKNKSITLQDGTWLAPSSVETDDEWYCVIERSEDQGMTWTASEKLSVPGHPKGVIQPTLWESEPGHVHALLRSRGIGRICRSDSEDGGRTWSVPRLTNLPNNNSGIDAVSLNAASSAPGTDSKHSAVALVYTPTTQGRTPLWLALSVDNGEHWKTEFVLEDEPGEYSYPAIIAVPGGVALCYTWKRERIRFHQFAIEFEDRGDVS